MKTLIDTNRRGEIVTFYSYKGGVGRTAALSNVAALLAQRGQRVLVMDFDLEAPGLHRYFSDGQGSAFPTSGGVIEFFEELRSQFDTADAALSAAQSAGTQSSEGELALRQSVRESLAVGRFIVPRRIADPQRTNGSAEVFLMPAGRFDADYVARTRRFQWQQFYELHPEFVDLVVEELGAEFDYVLIDSRTGTTDVGNFCTVLFPEKLVLVFTMNEQSLNGATEVGLQAVNLRKESTDLRPLPIFPLASRVENAEYSLQRSWLEDARRRFEKVFEVTYGTRKDLSTYFDAIQIPHRSFYSYGEHIAVTRERTTESQSLAGAFATFVDALSCNNAVDAQQWMGRVAPASRPPPNPAMAAAPQARPKIQESLAPIHQSLEPVAAKSLTTRRSRIGLTVAGVTTTVLGVIGFIAFAPPRAAENSAALGASMPTDRVASTPETTVTPPSVHQQALNAEPDTPAVARSAGAKSPAPTSPNQPVATGQPRAAMAANLAEAVAGRGYNLSETAAVSGANAAKPPPFPLTPDAAMLKTVKLLATSEVITNAQTTSGKAVYLFKVWSAAPAEVVQQIESVEYFFDHPSFQQKTFTSRKPPGFQVQYQGWGCLSNVKVTIRWKSKTVSTRQFDQCEAIP